MSQSNLLGVTLLRVSLGVMWIARALLKLLVFTLLGTVQFFQSVGFPGFLAYPVFASIALWLIGDGAFSVRCSERFVPSFKGA
jgi:uncharacterized membrane protein YphA (DoxX/SURF4 family)